MCLAHRHAVEDEVVKEIGGGGGTACSRLRVEERVPREGRVGGLIRTVCTDLLGPKPKAKRLCSVRISKYKLKFAT